MKTKIPHLILAGLLSSSAAHAATIATGDSIYVDFGETPTIGLGVNNILNGALIVTDAIRLSDGAATGVGIAVTRSDSGSTFTDQGAVAGNALNTNDSSAYGDALGINNANTVTMSITFTGLNDLLTYDLTGGFSTTDPTVSEKYQTVWNIAGQTPQSSDATPVNGYISFAGLASSDGTLTITLDRGVKNHLGVSQLQLTAVPEPSSAALIGLGGVALILRRRK